LAIAYKSIKVFIYIFVLLFSGIRSNKFLLRESAMITVIKKPWSKYEIGIGWG